MFNFILKLLSSLIAITFSFFKKHFFFEVEVLVLYFFNVFLLWAFFILFFLRLYWICYNVASVLCVGILA